MEMRNAKKYEWHTVEKGIRYRTEAGRRIGNSPRPDRYYQIRFTVNGKRHEESIGWESEGWTLEKVRAKIYELRQNHVTGQGTQTLAEARAQRRAEDEAKAEAERQAEEEARRADALVFSRVLEEFAASPLWPGDGRKLQSLYKNYIAGAIGDRRLDQIALSDLMGIRAKMEQAGKSPRTIGYVKDAIGRVYSFAEKRGLYRGENPARHMMDGTKFNNRRDRYLTPEEARRLMAELKKTSIPVYRQALISLNTGMRFGEIATLTWGHVHVDEGENPWLNLVDTKNGESRKVPLTDELRELFRAMRAELSEEAAKAARLGKDPIRTGGPESLVFPARTRNAPPNTVQIGVSNTFSKAVERLGLNEGRTDRRDRIVFHSLRHTAASWLVNSGVPLPHIARIIGHKTLTMTSRYSHVSDHAMTEAIAVLADKSKAIQSR